ncbi:hemin uptake protein HemP [Vogesella sp. DC21W]|uniref:Hemin uptake protein HemP n=1 Tax=Vogesella aquatica TaxID=2984206 RepID=A0ABT5J066_9NEIS|nr:hemin uptake protein HemP [Vogesella aquatica]MDC7717920.1 hemin uptake protein HemP [Vogesella aquatica]
MNSTPTQTAVADTPSAPALPAELVDIISSDSLFAQRKALLIEHNGQQYRLQITKQNKLILTK